MCEDYRVIKLKNHTVKLISSLRCHHADRAFHSHFLFSKNKYLTENKSNFFIHYDLSVIIVSFLASCTAHWPVLKIKILKRSGIDTQKSNDDNMGEGI